MSADFDPDYAPPRGCGNDFVPVRFWKVPECPSLWRENRKAVPVGERLHHRSAPAAHETSPRGGPA